MKLRNFYELIFDTLDNSEITEMELAFRLGIERANISQWRATERIPEKHFKSISNILNIPNAKAVLALKKDIEERFR